MKTTLCLLLRSTIGLPVLALVLALQTPAYAQRTYYVTDLGIGTPLGVAKAVNASGQVAGYTAGAKGHAFLLSAGIITDLGTLGGYGSVAYALNNNGEVAGYSYVTGNGAYHGFLFSGGLIHDLGVLDIANGLNDLGQVVGTAQGHAALYSNGAVQDLGTLGGSSSAAQAINNQGQVVGSSITSNGLTHAFLYTGAGMTDLGTLGGANSQANALNTNGQIVGSAYTSDGINHAFLYSGGSMTDLGASAPTTTSLALGINNSGVAVGSTTGGSRGSQAMLFCNGNMTNLNSLLPTNSSWNLHAAIAINDNGWIVGSGSNPALQNHAFLLTPAPYPYPIGFATGSTVSNGVLTATLYGTVSGSVIVETSSDLKTWTPIQTNSLLPNGVGVGVAVTNQPNVFIRARSAL